MLIPVRSSFAGIWTASWKTPISLIVLALFHSIIPFSSMSLEAEITGASICNLHVLHDLRLVVGCGASQGEVSCRRIPH